MTQENTTNRERYLLLQASSRLSKLEFIEGNFRAAKRWADIALEIDPVHRYAMNTSKLAGEKLHPTSQAKTDTAAE